MHQTLLGYALVRYLLVPSLVELADGYFTLRLWGMPIGTLSSFVVEVQDL